MASLRVLVIELWPERPPGQIFVVYSDPFPWRGEDVRMVGVTGTDGHQCYNCSEAQADALFRGFCRDWDGRKVAGIWTVHTDIPGHPAYTESLRDAHNRWMVDVVGRVVRND